MKHLNQLVLIAALAFSTASNSPATEKTSAAQVKKLTEKVADWQLKTFDTHNLHRGLSLKDAHHAHKFGGILPKYHDLSWHMGALYVGINEWRTVADNPDKYTNFLKKIGERNHWNLFTYPYHADDHAVGQYYLSLYSEFKDPAMLAPTRKQFDWILANPKTGSLQMDSYGNSQTDWLKRWGWCDALFMAPPVWARLAKVTGEQKYLDFMDKEYHASYDLLWDEEEQLFWRDTSYLSKREKNGEKLFWARGNGWVFGGLALMIPDFPKDWQGTEFYNALFRKMAVSIKNTQRADGTWNMGLLGGIENYPNKETSGTAFFAFGLAWGINNGLLDRATYEPVVLKAWAALSECISDEGILGYVQPIGAAPGESYPDKTEVYGIGAFLAAGTEVYKLLGGQVK